MKVDTFLLPLHHKNTKLGMAHKQIIEDISKKIISPIYLLSGEEPYYIDLISDYIAENILTEEEQSFNQTVIYGKDSEVGQVIQLAKRYPMMSNYQVVIIKEAQDLKKIEDLHIYAENPLKSTVLVICYKYKTFSKTTAFYKLAKKHGVVFESVGVKDYQIADWIKAYVRDHKYQIDDASAFLLGQYLGAKLHTVVNELQKLMIILPPGSKITKDDIEKNIGISKEYNVYELTNAFSKKDTLKVYSILQSFAANPKANPMPLTINQLYTHFKKILLLYFVNPKTNENIAQVLKIAPTDYAIRQYTDAQKYYSAAKLVQIISLIREYDLKTKGVESGNASDEDILRELAFKILH